MKKFLAILMIACFAFGMVACGDDDDAADNVGACEDLQDTINGLDCYADAQVDMTCDMWEDAECDISDYFDCVSDCYGCDGDLPTFDMDAYAACAESAECE